MGLLWTTNHYNTTRVSGGGGPSHVTVTEKKAPTDESVKLLNEFEEKARANIIAKVIVNDNTLNGVAIAYSDNMISAAQFGEIHIKFSVNGKEHTLSEKYDMFNYNNKNLRELETYLKDRMAAKVAQYILYDLQEILIKQIKSNGTY